MKIVIDLTSLYGRKRTGMEMYAVDLYRALLTSEHQIVPMFHGENEVDNNTNAIIIPKCNRLWLENVALSRAVRKIKADIVIFPVFPPPTDLYYGCKSKIFHTIHDTVSLKYRDTQNFAAKYYYRPRSKAFFKKGDGIITISETVKHQLQAITSLPIYNLGENISVDYKDADKHIDKQLLEKWGIAPEGYYISVSTIEPRKNFDYLLEVILPVLKEEGRKLVLVGRRGWGKNIKLQKMIEESGDNLIFTDFVTMEELFTLYHYAHAFALLSKDEGFGRTPFEAVACGCKRIILSDIEIFKETFEGNALFLPLDDCEMARNKMAMRDYPFVKADFKLPFIEIEERIKGIQW